MARKGARPARVEDVHELALGMPHVDGHLSVLLRASRIGEVTYGELTEVVQEAWLSRASVRRREAWLKEHVPD